MSNEDFVEDAEIDGLERRSWIGGLLRGGLWGCVIAAVIVAVLSLTQPLPEHLPGVGTVKVVGAPDRVGANDAAPADIGDAPKAEVLGADPDKPAGQQDDSAPRQDNAVAQDTTTAPTVEPDEEQKPDAPAAAQGPSEAVTAETNRNDSEEAQADLEDGAGDTSTGSAAADDAEAETVPAVPSSDVVPSGTNASAEAPPQRENESEAEESLAAAPSAQQSSDAEAESTAADSGSASDPASEATASSEEDTDGTEPEETLPELQSDGDSGSFQIAAIPPPQPSSTGDDDAEASQPAPEIKLDGKALDVNARSFDVPGDAPLMAVVLVNAASGAVRSEALALLTMPLTLTIGAESVTGRDVAEKARAAGHEILAELPMAGLEETGPGLMEPGQSEADLLAQATRSLAVLDLAVGATAPSDARLLQDIGGMRAVMRPVVRHGFAWVDPKVGTGSAARSVATAEGADWTGNDRLVAPDATEEQIYQNLESASLQARRKGTTIVFLTAGEPTLKALLRWGLERGGQEVWFAPISAVIARRSSE